MRKVLELVLNEDESGLHVVSEVLAEDVLDFMDMYRYINGAMTHIAGSQIWPQLDTMAAAKGVDPEAWAMFRADMTVLLEFEAAQYANAVLQAFATPHFVFSDESSESLKIEDLMASLRELVTELEADVIDVKE